MLIVREIVDGEKRNGRGRDSLICLSQQAKGQGTADAYSVDDVGIPRPVRVATSDL
jgi:hypothetical protein